MMFPFNDILLPTTVVGSYPAEKGHGLSALLDPYKKAVRTAIQEQISAGIDIISDGQVRGDMIQAFTSHLPGIRGQDVISRVLPSPSEITVSDTKYACSQARYVKGIITGPTTLSHGLHISTPMYRNREELSIDLAHALAKEAVALQSAGAAIIQIDEPIFSTGIADLSAGKAAISVIVSKIKIPVCLHVCGDVFSVIDEVLAMPVHILDFEFSKNEQNIGVISKKDLGKRMIGFGCVDSGSPDIESAGTIKKRILKGTELFDPASMLIDPDCGLRMLPQGTAYQKLVNMVAATREVREEI